MEGTSGKGIALLRGLRWIHKGTPVNEMDSPELPQDNIPCERAMDFQFLLDT